MKEYKYAPDEYMKALHKAFLAHPYEGVSNAEDAERAKAEVLKGLKKVFDTDALLFSDKPDVEEEWRKTREGCEIRRLTIKSAQGLNTLCYLVFPPDKTAAPYPAVVAVCGHGYGVRQILRQDKRGGTRVLNFLDNYQKNFALELAKSGCIVAAFEPVGFGEAKLCKDRLKPFYISSCDELSHHLLIYGATTAAVRIRQAIGCIDLLQSMPETDSARIGMMGISGGGLVSLYTALLDDRVSRLVVSGYINSFEDSILKRWHCPDNYFPGIAAVGDMSDFAAAYAPRPLLMEAGKRDALFPFDASVKAAEKIGKIYALYGKEKNFDTDFFDGRHSVSGSKSFGFFTGD